MPEFTNWARAAKGIERGPSEISVVIHSSPELKMAPWEFTDRASGSRKEQIQDKVKLGAGWQGGRDRTG